MFTSFMTNSFTIKNISLLTILIGLSFSALSQSGNPMQFMSDVSQSSRTNPSYQNKSEKLVVGLPFISGMSLNYNSSFEIGELISNDFGDFYNNLTQPGKTFLTANIPIFFASKRIQSRTFSFFITEKTITNTQFDEELINFLEQGTLPYFGRNEVIDPVTIKTQYYREVAFGYSNEIWKGLSIGVRPKVLFGKLYYGFEDGSLDIKTEQDSETLTIRPTGEYTVSGPFNTFIDEQNNTISIKPDIQTSDYFFKLRNLGAAIDLGLSYKLNKHAELDISVLDLGFTSLKHKTLNVEFISSFDYTEDKLYQSSDSLAPDYKTLQAVWYNLLDSIPFNTKINEANKLIIKPLPLKISTTFKQTVSNHFQFGISNYFTYYKNHSTNFSTLFARLKPNEKFEAVGTLSIYNFKRILPGIGISYTGRSAQSFISTNNILDLTQPSSAKNLNLCFGVNFLFPTD